MLIFIHGFNSSGNSEKAKRLVHELPAMDVLTPTCPYAPEKAITALCEQIESGLKSGKSVTLAGSSLGGFYAAYLAHKYTLASILINPLVDQTVLRQAIGQQKNYYTDEQYDWTAAHCEQLDKMRIEPEQLPIKPLLLLDEQDELINSLHSAGHYGNRAETHLFPGGSHRFDHMDEALPLISSYIGRHSQ